MVMKSGQLLVTVSLHLLIALSVLNYINVKAADESHEYVQIAHVHVFGK